MTIDPLPNEKSETSLGKALRLLSAVGEANDSEGIGVSDLMKITRLSRPTTYRLLSELQKAGYLTPTPRRPTWTIGPKVLALAATASGFASMRRRAKEHMDAFVAEYGHTVHLGIRDNDEVVYVDKSENPGYMTISSAIGQRRPVSVTALGKCLIAFDPNPNLVDQFGDNRLVARTPHSITSPDVWRAAIDAVRRAGFATDIEECDIGARCVAAPICDHNGYAIAAVSASMLSNGMGELDIPTFSSRITLLARRIGTQGD